MKKENKNITRKKLTKEFVEIYTFSLPHWRLAELGKKHLEKKLNKLSEKDFIEKLFLKAATMIRRGEGIFKDLTQSQKITQHDNLTKEALNYQKTGELPEAVHQYFGINPEHVYVQKLIKMEEDLVSN